MDKRIIIVSIFLMISSFCHAQLENANWCFGDSAGLKFTASGTVPITNATMRMYKGGATISDSAGNLLFYTNSQTVWNKNNDTMDNGKGIKPSPIYDDGYVSQVTQGAMILPKPSSKGIYYLFSLSNFYDSTLVQSEIDMNQNSGLGKVVTKNKFIYNGSLSDQMTAVKHGNGRDYWIICHENQTSRFVKFLLTPDSLIGPLYQTIGDSLDKLYFGFPGQSVFSPHGDKYLVVIWQGIIKLLDFDRCTGMFSNLVELSSPPYPYINDSALYGCSFSPDERKIYVSAFSSLYQYNLDSQDVKLTKSVIWQNPYTKYIICQQNLAIDNKIYFSLGYFSIPNSIYSYNNEHLCVIDSPNNKGGSCHVLIDTVSLGGKRVLCGLPNTVNYSLGALSECDTFTNVTSSPHLVDVIARVFPNPTSDEINIEILNGESPDEICIYDNTGRAWGKFKPHQPNSQLNIKELPSGVYYIQIKTAKSVQMRKIVKE